jgi:iron complex transport system substrate-binding protein
VRGVLAAIALCLLGLLAAGCGERSEPTGATVSLYPVTVTGATGQKTSLDAPPRRILAVGPGMQATLRALGVGGQVVTGTGTAAGNGQTELVTAWSSSPEASTLSRTTRGAGSPAVYIASDRTIADVERSLADLGILVGRPLQGSVLAERVDASVRRVRQRLRTAKPVGVFLDTGFFATVPRGSLADQMLAAAAGHNVVTTASAGTPVDVSELRRLDPRFYLTTSGSGTTLRTLERDRATARLSAVRARRFAVIRSKLLEPGPAVGAGVVTMARILHPDAFR